MTGRPNLAPNFPTPKSMVSIPCRDSEDRFFAELIRDILISYWLGMCASVSSEGLLFEQLEGGGEGGYKKDLLVRELSSLEEKMLICRLCKGVMREPCFLQHQQGEGEGAGDGETGGEGTETGTVRQTVAELRIQCPLYGEGCEWVGATLSAQTHLQECDYRPRSCVFSPYGCRAQIPRGKIETHMRENTGQHLVQLMEQVGRYSLQLEKTRIELEVLQARNTDLEASMSQQTLALSTQLTAAEVSNRVRGDGFCWWIPSVSEQITLSSKLWSPCFYLDGYKFQLMAAFGHEGSSYLALFLCLVRGERDAELEWPFRMDRDKFVFSLRNNSGTDVQLLTISPADSNLDNFKRPETSRNKARGTSELISLPSLSADYCTEDAVSLRVCVRSKTDPGESLNRDVQALLRSQEVRSLGYVWRVERVSRLMSERREEWGPSFYVGRYLFQPSVRFHCSSLPNMGLFIALFRGPYDSELSWPFRMGNEKFVFSVLDSVGHEAVSFIATSEKSQQIFSRPDALRNPAYGTANLMSHEAMQRAGVIVDDSIYIKIVIRK